MLVLQHKPTPILPLFDSRDATFEYNIPLRQFQLCRSTTRDWVLSLVFKTRARRAAAFEGVFIFAFMRMMEGKGQIWIQDPQRIVVGYLLRQLDPSSLQLWASLEKNLEACPTQSLYQGQ